MRTSGVVSKQFMFQNKLFTMYDVGGQRMERRKWVQYFDHANSLVFVAAISEYNQVLAEDSSKNRMLESLELFEQIVNSGHFASMSVILFLNKVDLFEEKIKTVDPKQWFPDYDEGCDYEKAVKYFKMQFEKRLNSGNPDSKRLIFHYTTCATNTKNVKHVFDSIYAQFMEQAAQTLTMW